MGDTIEDISDLRSNPSEEGEVDAGACLPRDLDGNKSQEGQEQEALPNQIQELFSFPNS